MTVEQFGLYREFLLYAESHFDRGVKHKNSV